MRSRARHAFDILAVFAALIIIIIIIIIVVVVVIVCIAVVVRVELSSALVADEVGRRADRLDDARPLLVAFAHGRRGLLARSVARRTVVLVVATGGGRVGLGFGFCRRSSGSSGGRLAVEDAEDVSPLAIVAADHLGGDDFAPAGGGLAHGGERVGGRLVEQLLVDEAARVVGQRAGVLDLRGDERLDGLEALELEILGVALQVAVERVERRRRRR